MPAVRHDERHVKNGLADRPVDLAIAMSDGFELRELFRREKLCGVVDHAASSSFRAASQRS